MLMNTQSSQVIWRSDNVYVKKWRYDTFLKIADEGARSDAWYALQWILVGISPPLEYDVTS